jgi:hypothetical protein
MKIINENRQGYAELLKTGKIIPFFENRPDQEYHQIKWSAYGLIKTNELALFVENEKSVYHIKGKSPLFYPPMENRVFGLDVADAGALSVLCEKLWSDVGTKLTTKSK